MPRCPGLILQQESEKRALRQCQRLFELEHRFMRLAVTRMNPPMRLVLPVDRLRRGDGRALVVVGGGAGEDNRQRTFAGSIRRCEGAEFSEVEVSVVPSTRAVLGKPVIGQGLQPHGAHPSGTPSRGDDVGVAIGTHPPGKPGSVLLSRQRCAAGGNHAHDLERGP